MDPILAALLNAPSPAGGSASSSSASSSQTSSSSPSDASSSAQFKSQFDQAVAALTNAAGSSTHSSNATTNAAQATTAGSTVQSVALADTLQDTLQKKIADLLQKGETVSEIVQQLAASLAAQLAQQFGGDPAQIQNQLQAAIASALSPPTGTGPPLSTTDLASALAQRFRQVADVAAGVLGETGQSNRLFAGSNSDAATTAGVQPAPTTTTTTSADSIASDAAALLASLTASQGDGKTVATNGAPNLGSNGDTLLGRILARATQAQAPAPQASAQQAQTGAPASHDSPLLTLQALAAAAEALGSVQVTTPVANVANAATQRVVADAEITSSANSGSTPTVLATQAPVPLNPAVLAFVKSFTDALATTSAPLTAKTANDTDPGALLQTDVSSSQAPTIGAFASVQAAVQNDALSANGSPSTPATPSSQPAVDPNLVVDQVLRGAFLNTVGAISTVRLRLVPEELGDISVKLTIEGNSVSAQVMAQTPAAHDALVAGQAQLERALADNGLKLTSFNVDLAGGFASFQQQQQGQSPQQGSSHGRNLLLGGVDTTETNDASLTAAPNFGPPVLAGASWSALNYLV